MEKIKNFIQSINTVCNKNRENSTHDDISSLKEQYFKWIKILHQMQLNRQFRRIILEIERSYFKYQHLHKDIYMIHIIKAQCIIKIIAHKLKKYNKELANNNYIQTRSVLFWFNYLFLCLEQLVLLFRNENLKEESTLNKVEQVIQIHLDTLYHLVLFDKINNNITQMCSYFAMVDNIKHFFNYCRHPRTLNLFRKIYLLRAVTLIANQDYDNSLKFQKLCVNMSFHEFFLVVDFDEGLEEYKQINKVLMVKRILKRNFVDMVIAFYLRGVCYEYLGDLQKTIEAYKQIRWFSEKFIHEREPELALFCERLERRAFLYHALLNDVCKEKMKLEKIRKQKENQRKIQIKQKLISYNNNSKNLISNKIYTMKSDLNFNSNNNNNSTSIECSVGYENDIINNNSNSKVKYPKTQYIMSTMKLINTLLEKDYMPVLNEMNTIEINKYNKEIINKIFNRKCEMNNKRSNKNSLRKSSSHCLMFSGPNISTFPNNKCPFKQSSKLKQNQNISFSPSTRYHPSKVQKLKFNNEQLSKDYIQKRNYLEKVNKKETTFLKKVLESKKIERNFHISFPDPNKMAKEAQNAFSLGLSLAKTTDNRTALQKLIESTKLSSSDSITNRFQCSSITNISKRSISSYIDNNNKNVQRKSSSLEIKNKTRMESVGYDNKEHSLSQNFFHFKKHIPPDLSNSNIVSRLNNDIIKKLNFEYEMLSQKGNSLNDKKIRYNNKQLHQQKQINKKHRNSLLKTYLQNVDFNIINKNK